MRSLKSVFGIIGTLFGIVYCGGLLYYFLDLSGSAPEAKVNGLGATMLGLAIIGGLFVFALFVKLALMIVRPNSSWSDERGGPAAPGGKGGFDSEAAFDRYMAQRPADAAPAATAQSPHEGGGPGRTGFGRK